MSQEQEETSADASNSLGAAFSALYSEYEQYTKIRTDFLDQLSSQLSQLGGPQDSHELRSEINARMKTGKDDLERQKQILVSLEQIAHSPKEQSISLTVGAELQQDMSRFQDLQKRSRDKLQEFIVRAQGMQEDSEEKHETSPLLSPPQVQAQQQALKEEISYNERLIEEREKGIKDIEDAMFDVREIFRDLGFLVNEQQIGIDHIEANVEAAASGTRGAVRELDRANEHRKSKAWTIYSFIVAIIILLIILLVLLSI
jgi:hypothetical protein